MPKEKVLKRRIAPPVDIIITEGKRDTDIAVKAGEKAGYRVTTKLVPASERLAKGEAVVKYWEKEASKMVTQKARPYASIVVGSKAEAEKIKRSKVGAKTIRVTISKAPKSRALTSSDWLVEFWEKRTASKKGSDVVIRTVEEKERSRSRTSKPKMPKESRSKSGTIETRGRRGHIRL